MLPDTEQFNDPEIQKVIDAVPSESATVKSAGRALRVLEFFDEVRRGARVAEIADRLSMPRSSTSVLLQCLGKLGYLDYEARSRSYIPSPRVALLGTWLDDGPMRDGSLHRTMEELSQKTGDAIILARRNGIHSQYIHVIQGRRSMPFHLPKGFRCPMVWSATGIAMLSLGPESEAKALCKRTNAEASSELIDQRRMLTNIRRMREKGYFFSKGLVIPGTGAIAMMLPPAADWRKRPLSICVTGLLEDIMRREHVIVAQMREAIQRHFGVEPAAKRSK